MIMMMMMQQVRLTCRRVACEVCRIICGIEREREELEGAFVLSWCKQHTIWINKMVFETDNYRATLDELFNLTRERWLAGWVCCRV